MATVTIVIQDNPLFGQPGQPNVQFTVSSDPAMAFPPSMENAEKLTLAQMAAIASIAHVADMGYYAAWEIIDIGSSQ